MPGLEYSDVSPTHGSAAASTLVRNVSIFDGRRVIEADSLIMRDGVIAEIGVALEAPTGARVVDGAAGTLLPGLIDSHVHALRPDNLTQALAFGVSTVLDMFCVPPHVEALRAAAAQRDDVADFRSAGIGATAPGGHPTQLVEWGVYPPFPTLTHPAEAESFVAARVAEGVDYIKVFIEDGSFWGQHRQVLAPDTVAAVITAAHQHGKMVLVHADSGATARAALDAGADALAHYPNDPDPHGELVAHIAAAGAFVIPTLRMPAAFDPVRRAAGSTALLEHESLGPY
ncbi:MAG: amidohydrolase family protein, partial [Actinobacteria bacterium]|nr:amidohydrolase family protein [Actinomycetota bacterium]